MTDDLRAVAAKALGLEDAAAAAAVHEVRAVVREPLDYDPFGAGRHLARLRGDAVLRDGRVRSWSCIEKITDGPAVASEYVRDNGLREARAYASGLLADLAPGIRAPAASAVVEADDGRITLHLEDLGAPAPARDTSDLVLAARALGRFAGRWLGRVPAAPWLFSGWLDRHVQPAAIPPGRERLVASRGDRSLEAGLGWTVEEALDLISLQPRLADHLATVPRTLCHHDAVAANVFPDPRDADGIVLIDWEMVGPGPVGADLVSLLFASARRGDLATGIVTDTFDDALAAYLQGLRAVGASMPAPDLRLAVQAGIALRWTLLRDVIVAIDDDAPIFRGSAPQESRATALAELTALGRFLVATASAVRAALV